MSDPAGSPATPSPRSLPAQIQMLVDRAPQDGKTPIALKAIAPALVAIAQQLEHLEYYVLQSRDGNWLLTTLQNNDDPELEKSVVYGFASIDAARACLKPPIDPDLVVVALPVLQILFQLLALDRVDSAIFFDDSGQRGRGTEVRRADVQSLANAHLQKAIAETQAARADRSKRDIPPNLA